MNDELLGVVCVQGEDTALERRLRKELSAIRRVKADKADKGARKLVEA